VPLHLDSQVGRREEAVERETLPLNDVPECEVV
jgi:hypothetical protein